MKSAPNFSSDDQSLLVGIPDGAVVAGRPTESTAVATLKSPIQPQKVTVPLPEEVNERYLEIREAATGTGVTAIEILSPKNKRPGEGQLAYERKRNYVLASPTHLVEVDLLREGKPFPIKGEFLGDYRILVCRGDQRSVADLYAFELRQSIPTFPIPLLAGDEEPMLELQKLLNYVYDRGRYHLSSDYTKPPQPPLSKDDMNRAKSLFKS